ncbi:hypothetical protein [Streptacidiphilus anmyonensis]|uniref:hypothetical protein n=1 Tax=Streptacidiphilus anmyonensis TaxID=405782 RepID=UPI0005A60FA4|nr:hypothetical protein [Streptacidiphilus anmyonensis]
MTDEARKAALRAAAQDPDRFAAYLADVQRVLLAIGQDLEILHQETRVDLRTNHHVAGDRWYHARLRALPVERTLKGVLTHLEGLTQGLEKATFKRRAHHEEVKALPGKREAKEIAKNQKKNRPVLPSSPEKPGTATGPQDSVYSAPASIFDLGDRRSA